MGKLSDRSGRHLRKIIAPENRHLIEPTDREICVFTLRIIREIYVVSDGTDIEDIQRVEGRSSVDHDRLSYILECVPQLLAIRARSDVRTKRAGLGDAPDFAVGLDVEDRQLR
jgi:hypothetical protein